jgi:hypothetical protein
MNDDEVLREFQEKLWTLINEAAPPDNSKGDVLMVSGALLSTCLKLYVTAIGSVKNTDNERVLH